MNPITRRHQPTRLLPVDLLAARTRTRTRTRTLTLTALTLVTLAATAAEPDLRPEDLPHFPPVEPADIAGSFELRPGFHIELAAAEPEVLDPVALSFDAQGRLYVVEMRDYSERRPERLGRVRRLEDRNGDGRFETSTVFLDNLPWPTAVTCWNDGVFVGSTPDVLYARDTDGDGRADIRETVFTGFASDFAPYATNKLNVQAMMNSLQWGPDCRIHGCGGMNGGRIQRVDSPFTRAWRQPHLPPNTPATNPPLDLRGRDFSFDPVTLELRLETGGGQHGMSFDDTGRKFLCSNSDHLQITRYDQRYASRETWFSPPPARVSIAADGPAAAVFRISPEEPWRVIRTRWRVTGLVQGLIEGGGRSSGYFTSATGITVYRGDAYGPDYTGDVFIADCGSNLVHRKKIRAAGCDLVGERPHDEQGREFLASRDTWFRPVQFANAPDGCLWILDMYREVIEHPWSIPPNLKRLIDLNSGNDRGRLIRIVPDSLPVRRSVNLAALTTPERVATLAHPNGWHRDTAARLLAETRDPAAIPLLRNLTRDTLRTPPIARFHALELLAHLHPHPALTPDDLATALADPAPQVRRLAIRLTESTFPRSHPHPLPDTLANLLTQRLHDTAEVRLQLAFSLGSIHHPNPLELLAPLILNAHAHPAESLVVDAALSSVGDQVAALFTRIAQPPGNHPQSQPHEPNLRLLPDLAERIGRRNHPAETSVALHQIAALGTSAPALHTALRLAEGLRAAGKSLAHADADAANLLKPLADATLRDVSSGSGLPQPEAIRFLAHLPASQTASALQAALQANRTPTTQLAAVEVLLQQQPEPTAFNAILAAWPTLATEARNAFLNSALRRPSSTRRTLEAIRDRTIEIRSLSASHVATLRGHSDPAIRTLALQQLGAPAASRHDAVAALLPALTLRGDPERGRAIHETQCATCHRLQGRGFALGPDLESVQSQPPEKLLVGILDPNREVQPTFLSVTIETTDGESLTGLPVTDTPAGITLLQAGGIQHEIPRARIASVKPDGRSLMPEGFEATLTPQQMADLLAALTGSP